MGWVITSIMIICLIIILSLPIKIELVLTYDQGKLKVVLQYFLVNICFLTRSLSTIDNQSHPPTENDLDYSRLPSELKKVFDSIIKQKRKIASYVRVIRVQRFIWKTELGIGEASAMGMIYGNVWTLKGIIVGSFSEQAKSFHPTPTITIIPHFQSTRFQTELICIGSIRLGKAIYTILKRK